MATTGARYTFDEVTGRTRALGAEAERAGGQGVLPLSTLGQAIVRYRGNLTRVAKALGIGRNTLYDKIRRYGIRR